MNEEKRTNNPFEILGVDQSADKKEILKQVTIAMRQRRYDAKTIAESQKALFNPLKRAVEEFQYFITLTSINEINQNKQSNKKNTGAEPVYPIPELLNFFDGKRKT
jgi:DnaJ-domain-containing protein 1